MELALRTRELHSTRVTATGQKLVFYKPAGSVAAAISLRKLRWTHVQHMGYCCSPQRRGRYLDHPATVAWSQVWQPSHWDLAKATERGEIGPFDAWAELLKDGKIQGFGFMDPRGDVPLEDTWWWGTEDVKVFAIIRMDDSLGYDEAERLGGSEEYEDGDVIVTRKRAMIDYHAELGMSPGTIAEIDDPAITFYPRHNYVVSSTKLVVPQVPEVLHG